MQKKQQIMLAQNQISSLFIENLNAFYGDTKIFSDCTFSLQPGELVCLVGPNGSGKSTLLSVLAGINLDGLKTFSKSSETIPGPLLKMKTGNFVPVSSLSRKQTASVISYLQQDEFSTWNFSVMDYVLQGRFCHTENANYSVEDENIAKEAMEQTGISILAERSIHSLSGGEFQKVRIARCLCQESMFFLFDEPAANLDFVYEPKLLEQLKKIAHEKNKGILVSIHDLNLAARFADRLLLLKKGEPLIQGKPAEVFTEKTIAGVYEGECSVYLHPVFNCLQVALN